MTHPLAKLLVVCGATGSGKGAVARELARKFSGEIVYADSRKIFTGLDIGTAKPSAPEQQGIPHHLLDVCLPGEVFSAHRYIQLADPILLDIHARCHVPVVVGGTGLYIKALLKGLIDTPSRNDQMRADLLQEEHHAPGSLRLQLEAVDPESAHRIPAADLMRIVRALEVWHLTGEPLSRIQRRHGFGQRRYQSFKLALDWTRQELYQRIEQRVERMMSMGWLEEVRRLGKESSKPDNALGVLGYRQLDEHLKGRWSLSEAVEQVKAAHRRYAKRQLSWFRADPEVHWMKMPLDWIELTAQIERFLLEKEKPIAEAAT
jgi:tRNA dimethylallyltransferase